MDNYENYTYDINGDFVSEAGDGIKEYSVFKKFLFYTGLFLIAELLVSIAVVTPPMLSIFPKALIFSIALCLIAFAGYIAVIVFGCRRLLRSIKSNDFIKIAYPAYGVIVVISELILLGIGIGGMTAQAGIINESVLEVLKMIIVWGFAPMRLFRMFGLDNVYSIAISHLIFLAAMTVTYLLNERRNEEQKGNIKVRRTKRIRKRQPDASRIKPKKTKVKVSKQPKKRVFGRKAFKEKKQPFKRRTRMINILSLNNGKQRSRHKSKLGRRSRQGVGLFVGRIERLFRNRYK